MSSLSGIFLNIPLTQIQPPTHPVREFTNDLTGLALSIRTMGLIEPIIVRTKGDLYEIVSGFRRLEACKMLNMSKVMCRVIDVNDKEAYEAALVENLQRRSMNPLEEAKAFHKYVSDYGWGGESELAREIGKSQEYVSRRIRVLDLPLEVQEKIRKNVINSSLAQELYSLSESDSCAISNYVSSNGLSNKEAREIVRVIKIQPEMRRLFEKNSAMHDVMMFITEEQKRSAFKKINLLLKKTALSLKISLTSLDDTLEEMEDYEDELNASIPNLWLVKDLIIRHRILLHDQLNEIIHQRKKLSRVQSVR
jgi:ParB family chromosome partitioning protein